MKKVMPILLIFGFFGIILQVVVNVFVTEKNSKYVIKTEDNVYTITEHLQVSNASSYYNIGITDRDGFFYTIFLERDFNKQTEIIRDIKTFKSNELSCIFPLFRRGVTSNVTCLYNDEAVSYDYLKQIGNEDIDNIVKQLKKEYSHNSWFKKESRKTNLYADGKSIDVYQDNILDDYVFLIWRYKGLYILKKEDFLIKDYLENDVYDNSLSAIVGRYYVTAVRDPKTSRVSKLYYYDTKELGKGVIDLLSATSSNLYFNGVYNKLLYMTDVGNKKQFSVDLGFEKVVEVGNSVDGFVTFENGKKKIVSAKEFLAEPVYYGYINNEDIYEKYNDAMKIKQDGDFYYFASNEGKMYRSHINSPTEGEILFQFDNITDWKVKNGEIFMATKEMIYFYSDREGLLPIAYNRELNYNNNNIIDFWKK